MPVPTVRQLSSPCEVAGANDSHERFSDRRCHEAGSSSDTDRHTAEGGKAKQDVPVSRSTVRRGSGDEPENRERNNGKYQGADPHS